MKSIRIPFMASVLTAAMTLSVAGCSSGTAESAGEPSAVAPAASASEAESNSSDSESETPQLWYINALTSYALYNEAQSIFEETASTLGYEARTAGSATVDIPEQITLIKQAIASGADGIIFCDLDPKTYESTIKEAQAKGIVMITSGGCVDEISDYSIGTDNEAFGQAAAETIARDVGEDAKVVVFATNESVPNQAAQIAAFKDFAASNYPNMQVVAVEATDADAAKAASKLGAATVAYPEANAYWFVEGAGPSAVPKALEQAGKKPGDLYVLAIDATPETAKSIEDGWISATLAQCFYWATPFAAELALGKLSGEGQTQQSWPVGVVPVGKADLPFQGCPDSALPALSE